MSRFVAYIVLIIGLATPLPSWGSNNLVAGGSGGGAALRLGRLGTAVEV